MMFSMRIFFFHVSKYLIKANLFMIHLISLSIRVQFGLFSFFGFDFPF